MKASLKRQVHEAFAAESTRLGKMSCSVKIPKKPKSDPKQMEEGTNIIQKAAQPAPIPMKEDRKKKSFKNRRPYYYDDYHFSSYCHPGWYFWRNEWCYWGEDDWSGWWKWASLPAEQWDECWNRPCSEPRYGWWRWSTDREVWVRWQAPPPQPVEYIEESYIDTSRDPRKRYDD